MIIPTIWRRCPKILNPVGLYSFPYWSNSRIHFCQLVYRVLSIFLITWTPSKSLFHIPLLKGLDKTLRRPFLAGCLHPLLCRFTRALSSWTVFSTYCKWQRLHLIQYITFAPWQLREMVPGESIQSSVLLVTEIKTLLGVENHIWIFKFYHCYGKFFYYFHFHTLYHFLNFITTRQYICSIYLTINITYGSFVFAFVIPTTDCLGAHQSQPSSRIGWAVLF